MRFIGPVLAVLVLGAVGVGAWRWSDHVRRPVQKVDPVPVAEAKPMDFEVTLLVTGTLEPAGVTPVVAVDAGGSVTYAVRDGSRVNPGDIIIRLDTQELQERLDQVQDQLQKGADRLDRAKRDGEKRVENAKTAVTMAEEKLELTKAQNAADLERGQAELDHALGEQQYAQGEMDKMQRLFDQGLATREELDRAEETLRKQAFNAEKSERSLANTQRQAAEREQAGQMDLDRAKLNLSNAETAMQRSIDAAEHSLEGTRRRLEDTQRQMEGCTLRTGVGGVVLLGESWGESGPHPIRDGDRIWQGMQVALVIDPAHVRVDCDVDEIDIRRIKAGQQVRLRVETAPEDSFPGKLESIDNIAVETPYWRGGTPGKKSFSALVAVDASDKRLKPGITAWLEIVVQSVASKISVPVEAVLESDGKSVVYRKRGDGFEKVEVTVGPRNDLYCAVVKGLKAGDKVARRRPRMAS